jgi:hypothetical protein
VKLGKKPAKSDPRALLFTKFASPPKVLPAKFNFWQRRVPFQLRSFGNLGVGDCTRASQANAAMRLERIEARRTAQITDEEVLRVYYEMTEKLYGGGDTGAYIMDALSCWRRESDTFRDTKNRPLTIDAYTRLDPADQEQVKTALWQSGAHGIAVGINLPLAWSEVPPPGVWDVPADGRFIHSYEPGTWGGHALFARSYDERGVWLVHSWDLPDQLITWAAVAAYMDEAYQVIDSVDEWRKRAGIRTTLDLAGIRAAVNKVSDTKI